MHLLVSSHLLVRSHANHRMVGLEGTLKIILFQPLCYRQIVYYTVPVYPQTFFLGHCWVHWHAGSAVYFTQVEDCLLSPHALWLSSQLTSVEVPLLGVIIPVFSIFTILVFLSRVGWIQTFHFFFFLCNLFFITLQKYYWWWILCGWTERHAAFLCICLSSENPQGKATERYSYSFSICS